MLIATIALALLVVGRGELLFYAPLAVMAACALLGFREQSRPT